MKKEMKKIWKKGVFSRDVMSAILVYQNYKTVVMLVFQTSHLEVEPS